MIKQKYKQASKHQRKVGLTEIKNGCAHIQLDTFSEEVTLVHSTFTHLRDPTLTEEM